MTKGLRATVLCELLEINSLQRIVVARWRMTRVLDPGAKYFRRARPDELPENRIEELRELQQIMRRVAARAREIEQRTAWRIAELEKQS